MAYSLFGQTSGTHCSNAIQLNHSQTTSNYDAQGKTETWFKFTANTSELRFQVYDDLDAVITLYDGDCANMTELKNDTTVLIFDSLTVSSEYLIKVEQNSTSIFRYALYNTYSPNELACITPEGCNLIYNGNFSLANPVLSLNEDGYLLDGSAFDADTSRVPGWTALWKTPDIYQESENNTLRMWSSFTFTTDPAPKNSINESAYTCANLELGSIYLLSFQYKKLENDGELTIRTSITSDSVDTYAGSQGSESTENYGMPYPIYDMENQVTGNIYNVTNTNFELFQRIFSPAIIAERFYVFPTGGVQESSYFNPRHVILDDFKIIPIEYDNIYLCEDDNSFTIEPSCWASGELSSIEGYNFSWAIPAGATLVGESDILNPEFTIDLATTNPGDVFEFTLSIESPTVFDNEPDNNQTFTKTVYVTYTTIELEADITHISCEGNLGAIDLTVLGGTPEYIYNWNYPNPTYTIPDSTIEDLIELPSGTYYITVTDSNGCEGFNKFTVKEEPLVVSVEGFPTYTDQACGSAIATPINGNPSFVYEWKNANEEVIGTGSSIGHLAAGEYTVKITDGTECEASASVEIFEQSSTSIVNDTIYLCSGQTIGLNVPNGYNVYLWNTGSMSNSISISEVGDYTCNFFSEEDCRVEKTFHVLPYVLNIDADPDELYDCTFDDFKTKIIDIEATQGFSDYIWSFEVYDYNDQLMSINIGEYTSDNIGYFTNPLQASHVEITVTADTPGGCTLTSTTTYYVDQAFDGSETDFNDIIINQDWINENFTFFTDVEFESGTHLIQNSHIEFAAGFGFVVSGANTKLIVDNSELTGYFCEDANWKGIWATGNSTEEHLSKFQPTIELANGSEISRAKVAIWASSGTIVKSNKSKYLNNEYSIIFDNYELFPSDSSEIINNKFIINNESQILFSFQLQNFIQINRVKSLRLGGLNRFVNANTTFAVNQRGNGVIAYKMESLDIINSNIFEGLSQAIEASDIDKLYLENNIFLDNYKGASFRGVNALVTKKNKFNDLTLMPIQGAYQMKIEGCTAPVVELNYFRNGVLGLYFKDYTNGNANGYVYQVYKNTFTGFDMYSSANLNGHPTCILFNGNHGSISHNEGAEVKCNEFSEYHYAIAVEAGEIKGVQGNNLSDESDAPAGNRFVDDTGFNNMPDGRFYKGSGTANGYTYLHHPLEITYVQPFNSTGITPLPGTDDSYDTDLIDGSCPTINSSTSAANAQTKAMSLQADISTEEELLSAKVDQGNTELLLSDITLVNDAGYTALAQEIQTIDSYLSDQAAEEFMDKPSNQPLAKTIALVANSPLPAAVQHKIADLDMSDELKGYIQAQQNGLSKKEMDEQYIHQLYLEKYKLLRRAIEMVCKDSLDTLYSPVIDLLLEQDDWEQKEMAYHMLKQSPRQDEAPALLLELEQDLSTFDTEEQYHLEDYLEMLVLENQLDTLPDTLRVAEIINHQALLEGIKDAEFTKGRINAKLLLEEAGLFEMNDFIQLPNPNTEDRSTEQKKDNIQKTISFSSLKDLIEVYPNPVDEVLTVQYLMFNGMCANTISIYDINGKLLKSQKIHKSMDILNINVSDLTTGTYIIAFGKEGLSNNSTKFIVK